MSSARAFPAVLPSLESLAVLVSGGIDSAILVGEALHELPRVHPLYVRTGLVWEEVELSYLRRYLDALKSPRLAPLHVLHLPVADVYGAHWSTTGEAVPDETTPDEAVFLPGRNVLLLSKALLWCHLNRVPAVALATLAGNPFPDATPGFCRAFADVVNEAVTGTVQVLQPYRQLHKVEVLQRGRGLPLGWSFSCIQPRQGLHCGRCNKCAERRRGFVEAGLSDPTEYREGP